MACDEGSVERVGQQDVKRWILLSGGRLKMISMFPEGVCGAVAFV